MTAIARGLAHGMIVIILLHIVLYHVAPCPLDLNRLALSGFFALISFPPAFFLSNCLKRVAFYDPTRAVIACATVAAMIALFGSATAERMAVLPVYLFAAAVFLGGILVFPGLRWGPMPWSTAVAIAVIAGRALGVTCALY